MTLARNKAIKYDKPTLKSTQRAHKIHRLLFAQKGQTHSLRGTLKVSQLLGDCLLLKSSL